MEDKSSRQQSSTSKNSEKESNDKKDVYIATLDKEWLSQVAIPLLQ